MRIQWEWEAMGSNVWIFFLVGCPMGQWGQGDRRWDPHGFRDLIGSMGASEIQWGHMGPATPFNW